MSRFGTKGKEGEGGGGGGAGTMTERQEHVNRIC